MKKAVAEIKQKLKLVKDQREKGKSGKPAQIEKLDLDGQY